MAIALNWLVLNHSDYIDMQISQKHLNEYPESDIPIAIDYHYSTSNKDPESTAVHDMEEEEGAETGKCLFVVNGITGEQYSQMTLKALKVTAL